MLSRTLRALPLLALAVATSAWAQFPTKPVTMIVPFAAGGPTDTVARSIAIAMQATLKQTVLVENVGGGTSCSRARELSAPRPARRPCAAASRVDRRRTPRTPRRPRRRAVSSRCRRGLPRGLSYANVRVL